MDHHTNFITSSKQEHSTPQVPNVSGSAFFFSVAKTQSVLIHHDVISQRIFPNSASIQLNSSNISGPLFCECRNYFKIPKGGKGLLCAFKTIDQPKLWHLGILNKILPDYQVMQMLQWKGPISQISQSNNNQVIYPSFYFQSRNQLCTNNDKGVPVWTDHLLPQTIDMDNFHNF